MGINKNELTLIRAVQESGESEALQFLVDKYQPMIWATVNRFYLRMFDRDDWQQEARIVCYQSCLLYETQHDCQFGAFFKLRFDHHVRNLVRAELALKRKSNLKSVSLDEMMIAETLPGFTIPAERKSRALPDFDWSEYLKRLSEFELQGFKVLANLQDWQAVCSEFNCDEVQLKRAIARCKRKLVSYLGEGT